MKKTVFKITFSILGFVVVFCAAVLLCMFRNVIGTVLSVDVEDGGLYVVDYKEDYKLDELLERGGVTNEDELVQYILEVMLRGLPIEIPYEVPELGCSTFNTSTTDGNHVFGRNYDNQEGDYAVVTSNPKSGYSSVSVVSLSFLGYTDESTPESIMNRIRLLATPYFPLDGVNEKGLAVGVLQLFAEPTNQQTEKPDVDTTLAIRIILDKAATVSEAIEILESYDMHASAGGCYHLHVADAEGDSAVVSWVDNEMIVTRTDTDYQCATNFFVHDVDFEYTKHGEDRYEIITTALEKATNGITLEEGMDILKSAAQIHTVGSDGNIYTTQWSSIYDLKNCTLTICGDMDYDNPRTYSVK